MMTVTGAEFNRYPSRVKRDALREPVVVTDRDRPSVVVLAFAEYERLSVAQPADSGMNAWEALRPDEPFGDDFDLMAFVPDRKADRDRVWDFELGDYVYPQAGPGDNGEPAA